MANGNVSPAAADSQSQDAVHGSRAPLLGSCRLTLSLMCLCGTLTFFLMRLNLSFALVCMVRPPTSFSSSTDDDLYDTRNDTQYAEELQWDKEEQGNMLSAFYFGFCVTQILGGWLSDRMGGSKVILMTSMTSMSLLSLVSPLVAVLLDSRFFFAVRLLLGAASGIALPTIQPLFARWAAPTERGTLIGLAFAGFTLGSSLTFPLSGLLCQYGFAGGWPSIFYLSGALGVVWVLLASILIFDSPELHPRISPEELTYLEPFCLKKQNGKKYNSVPWRSIMTSVPVHTLNACQFCLNWGFYILISGLPIFMNEALKFDITQNGLLSSMPYAAALTFHLLSGRVFDWCRRKHFTSLTSLRKIFNTIGFVLPALSMFVVGQLTFAYRYVAVFLLALSQAGSEIAIMGGFLLSNIDLAPQYSGVLQGISSTVGTIPGFVTPTVIAYLTPNGTQNEWANVFYSAAALYVFGAVIYVMFGTSQRQPWAQFNAVPTRETNETGTAAVHQPPPKCPTNGHQEEAKIQ